MLKPQEKVEIKLWVSWGRGDTCTGKQMTQQPARLPCAARTRVSQDLRIIRGCPEGGRASSSWEGTVLPLKKSYQSFSPAKISETISASRSPRGSLPQS